ncbi:MAG: chitobiase/beta-hexosaminidase C-terminal domain-containing protein [Bacteroidales bacterium]|nr:chitobiase/beta-hexosaminidase C-terminal domain-containing protein [Bacteroidales bacterium]
MKRKFTFLIAAAVMLLTMMASTTMWGQSDYSTTYSSNCTLTAGTNGSACQVTIGGTSYAGIKVGTSSNGGDMSVTVPAGAKYLHIHVAAWNGVTGLSLNITPNTNISPTSIGLTANAGISNNSPFAFSGDPSTSDYYKVITFTNALTESTTLTFTTSSKKRFVIWGVNPEEAGSNPPSGDPTITLSDSGTGNIGNYATNTAIYRDFTVTQSNLTDDISLNATNGGTFTIGDEVVTSIPASDEPLSTVVRWHFTTPEEAGQFTSVITATSGETSATCTYLGYAYANHNVIIDEMEHGTVTADPISTYYYQNVTLTVTPDEGYELGTLSVVDGNNDPVTVTNNSFKMPDSDATVSATFVESSGSTVTDELTNSNTIGETTNNYSEWTATGISGAEYAGQSAGGNGTIQLRSNNSNSGIVSTTSGGKVKKVTVTWNSNTADARTLNIYGSNTAYTAASDLYGNNAGTLLGTLNKGNKETNLNITDDYAYIGIRSASGALYLDKIEIDWETSGTPTCVAPTFTPAAGAVLSGTTVAISTTTDGATIYYTMGANPDDPTTSSSVYSTPIEITEATTIKAIAVKDGYNNSSIASASYTIATPLTTMQEIFDAATSTATNVYITFDNWVVSGASSTNAYVTDGTKGFIITNYSGHGFVEGNILSGTAQCSLNTNLGMARLQNFTSTADGLTVTTGGTVDFADIAMADLTAVNAGALLHYTNLLCSKVSSNYFLTDGTTTLQVYTALWSGFTNVLEDGKYYNITGVYHNFNTTKEICPRRADDIVEYSGTSLSINPATAEPFTYLHNDGPSEDQLFQVTGENLTSDDIVATITSGAEYFEITDDEEYSSTVTVNSGDYISVRMKAGLAKGSYEGTLTLSSTGAENIVVNLTGTVTGVTYTIESIASNGTISFEPASPVEAGTEVTLTATPDAGYDFTANSWMFYKEDGNDFVVDESITVTNSKITMPSYDIWVDGTFTAKPTYDITCVANPVAGGIIEASPASAYQGQTVILSYVPETGYSLTNIVITKTSDDSATGITPVASGDDYTFTMPGYAVTVTATFISNVFEGSFIKVTTLDDLEDNGNYVLVFNSKAMNSTLTSGRMGAVELTITDNTITNPDRSIVWKLEENGDNWDLYSEKEGKYCYIDGDGTSKFAMGDEAEYSFVVTRYNDGGFKFLTTEEHGRGIYQIAAQYASYAASNNPEVYLYKYTVLTERTITFNGNGGTTNTSATSYTQIVYDGVASTLTANQFAKDNSIFAGWALAADGDIEYADQDEVTIHDDLTLYAKWNVAYTATVADNIIGGTVKIDDGSVQGVTSISVAAGTEITLTQTPDLGYVFSEWNVYKTGEPETAITVTNNKFEMPEYNVTISATFNEAETYSLITNVNQIVSGKHYIIASGSEGDVKAMGQQYTNNRAAVEVTLTGTTISKTEGVYEFVINGPDDNDNYIIYDVENKGYLYAASSSSNYLRNQSTNDDNGIWSFTINTETGAATVIAQGTNTNKYMRFNNSLFSCYGSGSSIQNPVYFYMKDNDTDLEFYGTEINYTATSVPDGGSLTVGDGTVMTVPNNFENTDPTALIIEDGGQLIHPSDVQATVQKSVAAYTAKDGDGWYLIASPVDNYSTSTIATGTYDLFIYNEPNAYWYSSTGAAAPFNTLERGKGYLYANAANVNLNYAGTMKATNANIKVDLSYACDEYPYLKGFNLVGNPFTRNITAADMVIGEDAVTSYYDFNADRTEFVTYLTNDRPIQPGQGFFIQATGNDQQLEFNPASSKDASDFKYISISAGDENFTDKAYIQFGYGNTLRKMTFGENTMVYVMNNDDDYAAARVEELAGTMPVHFVPIEDGFYTITVETKNIENLNYMHLIDNIKNTEIDLLVEPSYTFKASESDNADRFYLVFDFNNYTGVNENYTNDNFAHQIGDEIFVSGEGTLQVFDVLGRFVTGYNVNGDKRISTAEFNTGVYIFRMVGTEVKTQKIIVR